MPQHFKNPDNGEIFEFEDNIVYEEGWLYDNDQYGKIVSKKLPSKLVPYTVPAKTQAEKVKELKSAKEKEIAVSFVVDANTSVSELNKNWNSSFDSAKRLLVLIELANRLLEDTLEYPDENNELQTLSIEEAETLFKRLASTARARMIRFSGKMSEIKSASSQSAVNAISW